MIFLKIIFFIFLMTNNLFANNKFYEEGLVFFNDKKFKKAKFKFEQDIVFNPKNKKSYLYLSKIFKELNEKELEKKNLNTVILLDPSNEEATYNLAKLKLSESDFTGSKKLIDGLIVFCKKYCKESKELKVEIEKSLKK
ncbi:MAG: hypothetical protein CMJ01_00035 [Pelagibacteraceae bacterium]|nr:hypothetical protein [Pelagibacteraceae bacterium]